MRFAILALAFVVGVTNAQFNRAAYNNFGFGNGQYQPGQYQGYQNGAYNPYQQFNRYQNYNQFQPYKPFVTSTPFPPKVLGPAKASASASVSLNPTPSPVTPVVPVVAPVPVAPAPFVPVVPKIASSDSLAETIRSGFDINPDGSYNYFYETNNGIAAQEQGTPRNFGGNPPVVPDVAQGSFAWTSPEGKPISITYVADENGYQPQGDAIPQPPEIPAQIARALEYISRSVVKSAK